MAASTELSNYLEWAPAYWYSDIMGANRVRSLALLGMGLCGEADEVFDETLIAARTPTGIARERLVSELGDWAYYWAVATQQCEISIEDLPSVDALPYEHVESLAVALLRASCKVAEVFKKLIRDFTEVPGNLRTLLAQALSVWCQILDHFGLSMKEVLGFNVPKVQGRYKKVAQ